MPSDYSGVRQCSLLEQFHLYTCAEIGFLWHSLEHSLDHQRAGYHQHPYYPLHWQRPLIASKISLDFLWAWIPPWCVRACIKGRVVVNIRGVTLLCFVSREHFLDLLGLLCNKGLCFVGLFNFSVSSVYYIRNLLGKLLVFFFFFFLLHNLGLLHCQCDLRSLPYSRQLPAQTMSDQLGYWWTQLRL